MKESKIKNQTNYSKEIPLHKAVGILAITLLFILWVIHKQNSPMSLFEKYLIFAGSSTMITAYALYRSNRFQDSYESAKLQVSASKDTPVIPITKGIILDSSKLVNANAEHDEVAELHASNSEVEPMKKHKAAAFEHATA